MSVTESEKKRLQSLKEKKRAFKAKGQLIQQALKNLVSLFSCNCIIFYIYIYITGLLFFQDNTTNNKKIIFDDVNEQQDVKQKKKTKRDLFDSDNDNNNEKDSLWNEDEFKVKKSKKVGI